jgi:hypothetical protein
MCEWEELHYSCLCKLTYRKIYECKENKLKKSCKDKELGGRNYEPKYKWEFNYECRKCDPCHPDNRCQV